MVEANPGVCQGSKEMFVEKAFTVDKVLSNHCSGGHSNFSAGGVRGMQKVASVKDNRDLQRRHKTSESRGKK